MMASFKKTRLTLLKDGKVKEGEWDVFVCDCGNEFLFPDTYTPIEKKKRGRKPYKMTEAHKKAISEALRKKHEGGD